MGLSRRFCYFFRRDFPPALIQGMCDVVACWFEVIGKPHELLGCGTFQGRLRAYGVFKSGVLVAVICTKGERQSSEWIDCRVHDRTNNPQNPQGPASRKVTTKTEDEEEMVATIRTGRSKEAYIHGVLTDFFSKTMSMTYSTCSTWLSLPSSCWICPTLW